MAPLVYVGSEQYSFVNGTVWFRCMYVHSCLSVGGGWWCGGSLETSSRQYHLVLHGNNCTYLPYEGTSYAHQCNRTRSIKNTDYSNSHINCHALSLDTIWHLFPNADLAAVYSRFMQSCNSLQTLGSPYIPGRNMKANHCGHH